MSVIAAMWSQSIPWRNPKRNAVTQDADPEGLARLCEHDPPVHPRHPTTAVRRNGNCKLLRERWSQKAGVSRQVPKTPWSASVTSPPVQPGAGAGDRAARSARRRGRRPRRPARASASAAAPASRSARTPLDRRRPAARSVAIGISRISSGSSSDLLERVHPDLDQVARLEPPLLVERGLGDPLGEPPALDAAQDALEHRPVAQSRRSRRTAPRPARSISSVSASTKYEPPSGSATSGTPVS